MVCLSIEAKILTRIATTHLPPLLLLWISKLFVSNEFFFIWVSFFIFEIVSFWFFALLFYVAGLMASSSKIENYLIEVDEDEIETCQEGPSKRVQGPSRTTPGWKDKKKNQRGLLMFRTTSTLWMRKLSMAHYKLSLRHTANCARKPTMHIPVSGPVTLQDICMNVLL